MTQPQGRPRRRRRPRRPASDPAASAGQAHSTDEGGSVDPASADPASAEPGAGITPGQPAANAKAARQAGAHPGRREDSGRGHGRDAERGWRELAGSSPSQVGLGGALRARDVARPTAADLAAAEQSVVLVRRQWQPPET